MALSTKKSQGFQPKTFTREDIQSLISDLIAKGQPGILRITACTCTIHMYTPTVSTGGCFVELFILAAFCTSQATWKKVKRRWWEGSNFTGSFTLTCRTPTHIIYKYILETTQHLINTTSKMSCMYSSKVLEGMELVHMLHLCIDNIVQSTSS